MAIPFEQLSVNAQRALEQFSDEFRQALVLGEFDNWSQELGLSVTSDAIKTTWPIPLDAAGYKEFKGDIVFRSLYSRSLSMVGKQWTDGASAPVIEIGAPDFIGWSDQPSASAFEWMRLPNEMTATMLESGPGANGPLLDLYRDPDTGAASTRQLFAPDHPYNVLQPSLGSFDNTMNTTVADIRSGEFFREINPYFRSVKGPNGKSLGLRMSGGTLLVPGAREELFREGLEQDTLIRSVNSSGVLDQASGVVAVTTQNNIYRQTVGYRVADELTNDNVFYAIAGGRPGMHVWVTQVAGEPEEIIHDFDSEMYKSHLRIGIAYVGVANVAAALPHRIRKVTITG